MRSQWLDGLTVSDETSLSLLDRAQQGDAVALEALMGRYLARLQRWATGRLPHWARTLIDTDDLVQETLLRTLGRIDDFEPRHEGALQAYLRQVLHNRIREEIRRVRRSPAKAELDGGMAGGGPSPLEEAVGRENLDLYEAALDRLPADDREAIVLRVEMGYSYAEIAVALSKPSANAARMSVTRALMRLAREIARGR